MMSLILQKTKSAGSKAFRKAGSLLNFQSTVLAGINRVFANLLGIFARLIFLSARLSWVFAKLSCVSGLVSLTLPFLFFALSVVAAKDSAANSAGVKSCQELFALASSAADSQLRREHALPISAPEFLEVSPGIQVQRRQGDQFPVLDMSWSPSAPQSPEGASVLFRFPKATFTTNPLMIGPHQMTEVGPFVGPRFFVMSRHRNASFRIQLSIAGEIYEARLPIRRSPTFIGLRALDFVSLQRPTKRLESWKPEIQELKILQDNNRDRELSIVGDLNITFNPSWSDLFTADIGGQKLVQFLLKGQRTRVSAEEQREIDHFVNRYKAIVENAEFARSIGDGGRKAVEDFLLPFGFESKELQLGGQLSMESFLAQWNLDPSGKILNIPSEPNLFGKAHGEFSHALQLVAMLKGATAAEAESIHRIIKSIVSVDRPDMWFCISGILTSFAGDGPNSTAWWPR